MLTRSPRRSKLAPLAFAGLGAALLISACMERADRWYLDDNTMRCEVGTRRCSGTRLERCINTGRESTWDLEGDCALSDQVCAPTLLSCTNCTPGAGRCSGQRAEVCSAEGDAFSLVERCDTSAGTACRDGHCLNLCAQAADRRSNVGCEYWAVDLDNAAISTSLNAAAQQFAVVLSNPQPDVAADVVIEQDDAAPGQKNRVVEVARERIPPFSLRVFKLGPREVDGSAPGTYDTGTGTALSRAAYRIRATVPIVAYQFNPLENVNVFSNDASLLKPVEAIIPTSNAFGDAYVVAGWPQTIAVTDDPRTNFSPGNPNHLRAFVTLVGTRAQTRIRVTPTTRVIPGGPVAETLPRGTIEAVLDPFDVLNLETGDFNADFTGSIVEADGPVVVFSGSEASDAPFFSDLSHRFCCADHLEEQLDPIRTAGRTFIATVSPNRSAALVAAGAKIGLAEQPESFRVVAATDGGARVTTTLAGDEARFELPNKGSFIDLSNAQHFALSSDAPVTLAAISPSQEAAGVPNRFPGGDPSLLIVPPLEQFRSTYVFLTPDKYSFDFIRVIAETDATIVFDGEPLSSLDGCTTDSIPAPSGLSTEPGSVGAISESWVVFSCQLSYPRVDSDTVPVTVSSGLQNDGVHRLVASKPVGVLVDGFDAFVSYAYAAGTELEFIVPE
ncbi:MAG TPA: IgGFc-binding protein [Polyangiaceae bacterium]|nr:IgGFc-binding protein [Polyangiaceae bacterium]